jgi:hypothetical protein
MTDETAYTPPKVWTWNKENGGQFANINRPVAGPTHEKSLPVGRHPLQLYSLATPNGVKVANLPLEPSCGRNSFSFRASHRCAHHKFAADQ